MVACRLFAAIHIESDPSFRGISLLKGAAVPFPYLLGRRHFVVHIPATMQSAHKFLFASSRPQEKVTPGNFVSEKSAGFLPKIRHGQRAKSNR
jgi:hypothetical protein